MRALIKLLDSLRRHGAVLAIVLTCAGSGLAYAQTNTGDNSGDPPSRVARLSWLAGDVGLLPAGASDWSDASVNRPLTTGDRLSSGDGARAALEFGGATLRLDNRTDVGVLDLNEQLAQVELTQGTLNLSVRHLDDGQSYEIDTPTVALVIDQPGRFRVDIDGDATRITAFEGSATVYGENNAQRTVSAGRSYRFMDSGLATVAISEIDGGDNFDAWVNQRDQRYAQLRSNEYVSPDVVGYQDLDEYGDWQDNSDYGAVWYPRNVAVDWAPYRDGRWAYIAPWGWTWIDATPWGYAPYHYGRWAHTHRGWGWIPGPRYARPIYAPALVAFVGGGGFSVGIGSGPIGWFPLGPGEIYNPWYRSNRDYYRRINVTNIRVTRNITNVTINNRINNHYDHYRNRQPMQDHYVNRHAPRGFTAISGREFAAGGRVQRNLVKVDSRKLADARVLPHGIDVKPDPGRRPGERSEHVRQLPRDGFRREVVARHAPPVMAQHRVSPANERTGSRVSAVPVSHVRVLDPRNDHRPTALATNAERQQARLPKTTNVTPNAPVAERRISTNEPPARAELRSARFAHPQNRDRTGEHPAAPQPGVSSISSGAQDSRQRVSRSANAIPNAAVAERRVSANEPPAQTELNSARFAHPQRRDPASERPAAPRPGVSYISNGEQDSRQRVSGAALPQAPRIERADRIERPVTTRAQPSPRNPVSPTPRITPERSRPEPRAERAMPAQPAYVRSQARPQSIQREMPRPVAQQPRYEQPREQRRAEQPQPRYQAQPQPAVPARTEAQKPQRSEAHQDRKSEPRRRDDGQQQ